jgi:hypothetical protein
MKKEKYIQIYKSFKVGDAFTITNKPSMWDSSLNDNCPMYIDFPYNGKILKMRKTTDDDRQNRYTLYSMTDGLYGWDMETLVKENRIINIRLERKRKLKKINETNILDM